ncbi:serine protease [uncultured Sphingomonas sp.]|uniref:S1 family peptidase n=1 Tax=uncultured Sphingomonas sp. TaxID=158754 RepID=UPI0025F9B09C|nr:serine protease [uncultured Sphingomonas sp.]
MQADSVGEQLFFTTVRIDTVDAHGNPGSGTGFYFEQRTEGGKAPFIVTNKHVALTATVGQFTFLKSVDGKPSLGDKFELRFEPAEWASIWFGHPDPDVDIAVCGLAPLVNYVKRQFGHDLFFRVINSENIPTALDMRTIDAVETINFIGYPNGVWDSKNLLPVFRTGVTATPMSVDFEGTPRFIIDASVFGGSSGSPVFIWSKGGFIGSGRGSVNVTGPRFFFVGVVAAVFYRTQLNQIIAVPIPTQTQPMAQQQEMIDLGIVFKAHTVVETCLAFLEEREGKPAPIGPPPA